MGPWTHALLTVHIVCDAKRCTAEARVVRTPVYPLPDKGEPPRRDAGDLLGTMDTSLEAAETLVIWLASFAGMVAEEVIHVRIVPLGERTHRQALFALPWHHAIPRAVISFARGKTPDRPRLRVPLVFSSPRGERFVDLHFDDFVRATTAAAIGTQGHVVLATQKDRVDHATAPRTRLLVIDTDSLAAPPVGPFNVLQVAGDPAGCTEFVRLLFRAILHDAPLDAAIHHAFERLASHSNVVVRMDLFEGDEHCVRPRLALRDAASSIEQFKPIVLAGGEKVLELTGPSVLESTGDPGGGDPLGAWANHLNEQADYLDYAHEIHGANATASALEQAHVVTNVAEACGAVTDEIELDRAAQLWLEDATRDVIAAETPVTKGQKYWLRFQIATEIRSGAVAATLPSSTLRDLFVGKRSLGLVVVLYADPAKLRLARHRFDISLERWGATDIEETSIIPLKDGTHHLRACVFYRGNLLQSLFMRIGVGSRGVAAHVDYSGIETFRGLSSLPPVGYSLWINDTGTGDHWIGLYTSAGPLGDLDGFNLATPSVGAVNNTVPQVRKALATLQGDTGNPGARYRFAAAIPPSDAATAAKSKYLVELAREGRRMFERLLQQANVGDDKYIADLANQLKRPDQVLSIARLDNDSSVPWSLMYDQRIDPANSSLALCTRYERSRADGTKLAESPGDCRSQADCPLAAVDTARKTVCPFGFWGFRHQIELRLRNRIGGANAIDRTRIQSTERPPTAAAMFDFPESPTHIQALAGVLEARSAIKHRDAILEALRAGDRSIYYFFCHAVQDSGIRLTLAPDQFVEPASIAARYEAEDDGWAVDRWESRRPLVFLNACQSIALDAQLISPFLDKFVGIGASALIGTEVRVYTELAANFATDLLTRMVTQREPLGAALLKVRRTMLGQGNPMGLAYSAYGSAALHFHTTGCTAKGCT